MTPQTQTVVALAVVALAAGGLLLRFLLARRRPGCGGTCGCDAHRLKAKLKP